MALSLGELLVQVSELTAANNELNKATETYEEATENAKKAADELAETWEGDSQVAFVQHQDNAYRWSLQIVEILREMFRIIAEVIEEYRDAIARLKEAVSN